jgi:phage shock protein E
MNWLSRWISRLLPSPPEIAEDEDVVFVDVRSREEYAAEHVKGARHIPYDQMARRWPELKRHKRERVLVYCRTGRRSRIATGVLRAHGFENAENAGGIGGLRRAGIEIE